MKTIADLSIAILAGGLGTRLRSVVNNVPKVMAPINGAPFFNYLLDGLIVQGARGALLCTGFEGEQIRAYYSDNYRSLGLTYSNEEQPLGTAGALRRCIAKIQSDHVLVINGDTFCDANLNEFVSWHHHTASKASILLVRKEDGSRFGSVETDKVGNIVQFHEKSKQSCGYVSAGIYLLDRAIVENIPDGQQISMEYEVLPKLIGIGLCGYKTKSSFIDIGTPESYRMAQLYFSERNL
jgi:D-glycero-alpha-D-manno-heptose 1-phosphate guanylyltransferase